MTNPPTPHESQTRSILPQLAAAGIARGMDPASARREAVKTLNEIDVWLGMASDDARLDAEGGKP